MSIRDEIKVLRDIPPFAPLDTKQLELLAYVSERLSYEPGTVMIQQGDAGDAVFVLLEGMVDVTIASEESTSHVRELGEYAFVGELAVLKGTDRTATVTVKTPVSALKISKETLLKMIEDVPDLGKRISDHMSSADYVYE